MSEGIAVGKEIWRARLQVEIRKFLMDKKPLRFLVSITFVFAALCFVPTARTTEAPSYSPSYSFASAITSGGYFMAGRDGSVYGFNAPSYGSLSGTTLNKPIVGMASTSDGKGYWLVASDGGIFTFGDAAYYGSTGAMTLNKPIVGMASTPDGKGYWLVASDGGIFTFGDAAYYGSTGGSAIPAPIVGIAALPAPAPIKPVAQVAITTASLANAVVGSSYSATLTASGGVVPYSWTLASGALPAGLSLSSSGVISGIPASQGGSTFLVQVTDSSSPTAQTATATLAISVLGTSMAGNTVVSSNWSGYIAGGGLYSAVSGSFTVPSLEGSTLANNGVGEWIGIGGVQAGTLIQAGIGEFPDPTDPNLFYTQPFWEVYPAPANTITGFSVTPGDQVTVTIAEISGSDWSITVKNDTNGETFTTDQTYSGSTSTAEWIVEAPTINGSLIPLAPYSPDVSFTGLSTVGPTAAMIRDVMVQNYMLVSTPSVQTSTGFNVAYGDVAPPGP